MIVGREGLCFSTALVEKNYRKLAGWKGYVTANEIRNESLSQVLSIVGTWEDLTEDRPHYEHKEERERDSQSHYQHREERERQAERQRGSRVGRIWPSTQDIMSKADEGDTVSERSTKELKIDWDAVGYPDVFREELPLFPSDYKDDEYLPPDLEKEENAGRKRKRDEDRHDDMNMSERSGEEDEPDFEVCDLESVYRLMKTRMTTKKEMKLEAHRKVIKKEKKAEVGLGGSKAKRVDRAGK